MTRDNEGDVILYQDYGDMDALARLVKNNEGLVFSTLNIYLTPDIPEDVAEDIAQEARICILKCAKWFDRTRNIRFSTLFVNVIRRVIYHKLITFQTYRSKTKCAGLEFPDAAIEHSGFSETDAREDITAIKSFAEDKLKDRQYEIMMAYLGEGRKLRDIARDYNISHERVRQIAMKALRTCQAYREGP